MIFRRKSAPTEASVREALAAVPGPDGTGDLVSLGHLGGVTVDGSKVFLSLSVPASRARELEPLRIRAQEAVEKLPGVDKVIAVMTGEVKGGDARRAAPPPPQKAPTPPGGRPGGGKLSVSGVRAIVAVASGKGGVGKSTTAVNLALAASQAGRKVGLLDADIYGPSLPRMLGVREKPTARGKVLDPLVGHGLKVMSMGFLVEEDTPMIWRGPMVISALTQMLREVDWAGEDGENGGLDLLVVDMPPGTGDAQLTMAQQVPLSGAVIVSTPQDIALIDARKGLNMFRKTDVPILGLVENMSLFVCPKCGEPSHIFGHGGARDEAERLGVPFLGEVPLHIDIRTNSDSGTPVVASDPDGPHALIYREIADAMLARLDEEQAKASGPAIVFD